VTLLARRDFCCSELVQTLVAQGFEPATAQSVLAQLIERGYVNDERYAMQFVSYRAERGLGPLRIRRDLEQLGVGAEWIETALRSTGPRRRARPAFCNTAAFPPIISARRWAPRS